LKIINKIANLKNKKASIEKEIDRLNGIKSKSAINEDGEREYF